MTTWRMMIAGIWLGAALGAFDAAAEEEETERAVVRVEEVRVVDVGAGVAVLLEARGRNVPIFVDSVVGASIAAALSGVTAPRPTTHDLLHTVFEHLEARVERATIRLHEGIFYGELVVENDGKSKTFDSRSSDAIAIAVRAGAPMYVSRHAIDAAGQLDSSRGGVEM